MNKIEKEKKRERIETNAFAYIVYGDACATGNDDKLLDERTFVSHTHFTDCKNKQPITKISFSHTKPTPQRSMLKCKVCDFSVSVKQSPEHSNGRVEMVFCCVNQLIKPNSHYYSG